jgi:hypothetical protein
MIHKNELNLADEKSIDPISRTGNVVWIGVAAII